jgi:hypothetical protein
MEPSGLGDGRLGPVRPSEPLQPFSHLDLGEATQPAGPGDVVGNHLAGGPIPTPSGLEVRHVDSCAVMYHYGWARTLRGAEKPEISCTVQILEAGRRLGDGQPHEEERVATR